jgi:amino acid permease
MASQVNQDRLRKDARLFGFVLLLTAAMGAAALAVALLNALSGWWGSHLIAVVAAVLVVWSALAFKTVLRLRRLATSKLDARR